MWVQSHDLRYSHRRPTFIIRGRIEESEPSHMDRARRKKENKLKTTDAFRGIDLPGRHDVLSGRGKTVHQHTGNIQMRHLVQYYVDEYRPAPRAQKCHLVAKVVSLVQKAGGQFLEKIPEGWWVEISTKAAEEKVDSSFRRSCLSRARPPKSSPLSKGRRRNGQELIQNSS
jgi:hypothetical protein